MYILQKFFIYFLSITTLLPCFKAKRAFWDSSSPQGLVRNLLFQQFNKTQVATPTFSPNAGVVTTFSNITISTTTLGATIYYTTDGTNPTTSSSVYNSPLENVWSLAGKTITAFAVKDGMLDSSVVSGIFSYPPVKTGQIGCWGSDGNPTSCVGSGHDGEYKSGVARAYTNSGDGTVTDNATGLIWQKCSMGRNNDANCSGTATSTTWMDAQNYCKGLSLASRTWRLPTRLELETLPDYGKSNPAIDLTVFPNTDADNYWSSSTYNPDSNYAWMVYFYGGDVDYDDKTGNQNVRCVSGLSKEYHNNFTDNGNGTVRDNVTGLIWQKCSMGQNNDTTCSGTATTASWSSALNYCNTLSLASRTWRLPNVNELKSIVDTTTSNTAINSTVFPSTVSALYWTSTTYTQSAADAWVVDFNDGRVPYYSKGSSYHYVRCVSETN